MTAKFTLVAGFVLLIASVAGLFAISPWLGIGTTAWVVPVIVLAIWKLRVRTQIPRVLRFRRKA